MEDAIPLSMYPNIKRQISSCVSESTIPDVLTRNYLSSIESPTGKIYGSSQEPILRIDLSHSRYSLYISCLQKLSKASTIFMCLSDFLACRLYYDNVHDIGGFERHGNYIKVTPQDSIDYNKLVHFKFEVPKIRLIYGTNVHYISLWQPPIIHYYHEVYTDVCLTYQGEEYPAGRLQLGLDQLRILLTRINDQQEVATQIGLLNPFEYRTLLVMLSHLPEHVHSPYSATVESLYQHLLNGLVAEENFVDMIDNYATFDTEQFRSHLPQLRQSCERILLTTFKYKRWDNSRLYLNRFPQETYHGVLQSLVDYQCIDTIPADIFDMLLRRSKDLRKQRAMLNVLCQKYHRSDLRQLLKISETLSNCPSSLRKVSVAT